VKQLGDVVKLILFFRKFFALIAAGRHLSVLFSWCLPHVLSSKRTRIKLGSAWTGITVDLLLLSKLRGMCSNRKLWRLECFLFAPTVSNSKLGVPLLLLFVFLLGIAYPAQAATVLCSDFGGIVDGNDPFTYASIQSASTFGIDMNCTVKNFPESVGGFPITNINFQFPRQQSYYIVFNNVYYYGNMSCNDPTQSDFWIYWTPGGFTDISPSCQEFMVPVDAVLKKNPPDQTTATIGVPFSYSIIAPLLGKLDSTGTFQYIADADDATITNVVIADDLTTTGAALSYVSNTAYLVNTSTGARTSLGPLALGVSSTWLANHPSVSSDSSKHLVFSYENNSALGSIAAGYNIEIDLTVVLDNSSPNVNQAGTIFSNTSRMWFDKPINSTDIVDLQAHPGTTLPMTIIEPNLVVDKTSPMSNLNVGTQAPYTINVQNTGSSDAWNATITDNIPTGMCTFDSSNTVTAQILASDGVTHLQNGTDFSVSWGPSASGCQLSLQMLTDKAKIGPTQRLIIDYQAMLDNGTPSGTFTNVAGATRWFNAESSYGGRRQYDRTLTDGTPSITDFQDAYTITAPAQGYYFLKSVDDLTTGAYQTTTAFAGDRLRYTLQLQNFNIPPLNGISVTDDLGALNRFTAFVPGSLALASTNLPAGTYTVDPAGGTNGAGTVTVNGLNLDSNTQYQIQFDVTLAANLTGGTIVRNQASLSGTDSNNAVWSGVSDDPYLNGPSLLNTTGDITSITIRASGASAPAFSVQKTVQDITSGTSAVMAGDTLRYTITVKNIGTENAIGVTLRDLIPANTSYVANSTRLNGVAVADPSAGVSALQNGMLINSPANLTPGVMLANASAGTANTAAVTFDAQISTTVVDGTIISNQGFVNGAGPGSGPFPEQPSDDPATPILNDPTKVVVGNVPLVYALKTVNLIVDNNGNGLVDPGDVLRYAITLTNSAFTPATGVVLTDAVPADTTYVTKTTTLNGEAVADPSTGVSPLANGMGVVSSGLPPSSPPSSGGTLAAHGTGTVTFDVQVNLGVLPGTLISNQGRIASNELPLELTDADGMPANGYQPTVVVVGDAQLLSVTKEVAVVGGGTAQPGGQLEYTIRLTNISSVPATQVVVTDNLGPPLGDQVTYVAGSGTLNGTAAWISFAGSILTASYGTVPWNLQPGASAIVRFRVRINAALAIGTTITNIGVVHWNNSTQTASDSVSILVGGMPTSAGISGRVWHDANLNKTFDSGSETGLARWSVELYRNNQLIGTQETDANGVYHFSGLVANEGTPDFYELRFRAEGAGPNTASMGNAHSPFTNGPQRISAITVASGANLQNLNMPIWPNGTVYNSVVRKPVAGARLALLNAATGVALPSQCFDDPVQQNQITAQNGFYKFDLNFSSASCPSGGAFIIEVTPPPTGYQSMPSQIIPPTTDASTQPFSVPTCPGSVDDAVPATDEYCEAVVSAEVPLRSVLPHTAGTIYHLHLLLGDGNVSSNQDEDVLNQSQIFNNQIPIDPELGGAVAITKTSSLINVTRGELVPYTITISNVFGAPLSNISIVDTFPAGFKYVKHSARVDGRSVEPDEPGLNLIWDDLELQVNQSITIQLLLVVGSGVSEGKYVNRAVVLNTVTGLAISGQASATVEVIPDPTFDCTDVIGKVFDDRNLNGQQEAGEKGLHGVRVVTARGLIAATDEYGRFHITCAAVPDEDRGSNFILKLDERSLPTGYRMTTENPRVQRATRGKMIRFNFGATIHRVVRIDIADGVFEPDTTEMRAQWIPKIALLLEELKKAPSILRLSYLGDIEKEGLVQKRLESLKKIISNEWKQSGADYRLTIETEIYWRRGAPFSG